MESFLPDDEEIEDAATAMKLRRALVNENLTFKEKMKIIGEQSRK